MTFAAERTSSVLPSGERRTGPGTRTDCASGAESEHVPILPSGDPRTWRSGTLRPGRQPFSLTPVTTYVPLFGLFSIWTTLFRAASSSSFEKLE